MAKSEIGTYELFQSLAATPERRSAKADQIFRELRRASTVGRGDAYGTWGTVSLGLQDQASRKYHA